jgi:CubicO group peptidase (beta-lactamase class C family)
MIMACHITGIYDVNRSYTLPNDDYSLIKAWADSVIDLKLNGIVFHNNFSEDTCLKYRNEYISFVKIEYDGRFNPNIYRYLVYDEYLQTHHHTIDNLFYEKNIPVNSETLFRVASISKTITAIAFMQLVEQNKISLDENISKLLGFTCSNPYHPEIALTPRMLLSHTSTLTDDPNAYDQFLNATYENNPVPNLASLLTDSGKYYSKNLFLNQKPGTYFNYCNLNYGIIGTIIEKISGLRFDEYCSTFIFKPLGINATFNVSTIANINNLATLYRKTDNVWTPQTDYFNGVTPVFENINNYIIGTNAIRFAPQGGLRISATDLSKIFSVFLNDGKYQKQHIISKASIKSMTSSQWKFDGTNGENANGLFKKWGLGIHLITNTKDNDEIFSGDAFMLGHSGDAYGLVSDAFVDVKKGIGFVFITNGSGSGYVNSDCSSFYAIEKDIFEAVERHLKKQPAKVVNRK